VSNAQGKFRSAAFRYRFDLFRVRSDGSTVLVDVNTVDQGSDTTSYTVSLELKAATPYQWRTRAELDGATGPWSVMASFSTPSLVSLGAPNPTSPINGETTTSLRPALTVQNGAETANAGTVVYEYHLDDEGPTFPNPVLLMANRSVIGTTSTQFEDELAPSTQFWWRARATNGTVTTNWSVTATFLTPSAPTSPPTPPSGGPRTPDPTPGTQLPLPNQAALVEQVAAQDPAALANSCIEEGGSWRFMDAVVTALRATDTRWGYNCKRGNCSDISIDVVDYFHGIGDGQNSTDVYLIDVISAVCPGGNQSADWIDQTGATADEGSVGRWIYPRPQ